MATSKPPELNIPAKPDPMFMRADFNGVTLPGTYEPSESASIIAQGGCTMTSGPYTGLFIPYLVGANTTPPTMIMTTMLALYWVRGNMALVIAVLTEHAKRNYTHLIWDSHPWNLEENGMTFSIDQAIAWGKYIKSWGFYNVIWSGYPDPTDPMWAALAAANLITMAVLGEEVNSKFSGLQYTAILNAFKAGPMGGIPCLAHFTSNYPIDFPLDTYITNWADYDGWLHLAWQADPNDSAGRQAAMMYYARMRVNLGTVGGDGRPAPNSRVYAFEVMASNELYGKTDEQYGCLRSLELLYAPADNPAIAPIGGTGDGCRHGEEEPAFQNGQWI